MDLNPGRRDARQTKGEEEQVWLAKHEIDGVVSDFKLDHVDGIELGFTGK